MGGAPWILMICYELSPGSDLMDLSDSPDTTKVCKVWSAGRTSWLRGRCFGFTFSPTFFEENIPKNKYCIASLLNSQVLEKKFCPPS